MKNHEGLEKNCKLGTFLDKFNFHSFIYARKKVFIKLVHIYLNDLYTRRNAEQIEISALFTRERKYSCNLFAYIQIIDIIYTYTCEGQYNPDGTFVFLTGSILDNLTSL